MALLFTRKALEREAHKSANVSTDSRRRQVEAADGTPEGDREAARWRHEADAEEAHGTRAGEAARRPAWRRLPVSTPPAYLAEIYGRD